MYGFTLRIYGLDIREDALASAIGWYYFSKDQGQLVGHLNILVATI